MILFLTLNRFHILFWVDLYFEQVNTDSEAAVRKNSLEVYFLDLGFVRIKKKTRTIFDKVFPYIFVWDYILDLYDNILAPQSWTKYLAKRKKMKRNWTKTRKLWYLFMCKFWPLVPKIDFCREDWTY